MKIYELTKILNKLYPPELAENWDNIGLLLGDDQQDLTNALIALELTDEIIDEAINTNANLIITHHPYIFKPLKSITTKTPIGKTLLKLASHNISLFAAHTNLDAAPNAIAKHLADSLKLTNQQPFHSIEPYSAFKLITFVPHNDAPKLLTALHTAGAGAIGNYTNVSFRSNGTGHFTCSDNASPAIGTPGSTESVEEMRVELLLTQNLIPTITKTLLENHPYEEPAFDIIKLHNHITNYTDQYAFGTIGFLPQPLNFDDFIKTIKFTWNINSLRASSKANTKNIHKIAILNGSGAKFLPLAIQKSADALITGDCNHHDFDDANRANIALIDAGHYETEKYIPSIILRDLQNELKNTLAINHIHLSKNISNPTTFH